MGSATVYYNMVERGTVLVLAPEAPILGDVILW
jgi:hypothetical protein